MNDVSALSAEARALLADAQAGDEPTADDRARVRGALAAKLAAGLAASAVVAATAKSAASATAAATGGAGVTGAAAVAGGGGAAAAGGSAILAGAVVKIGATLALVGTVAAVSVGTAVIATRRDAEPRTAPAATATAMLEGAPQTSPPTAAQTSPIVPVLDAPATPAAPAPIAPAVALATEAAPRPSAPTARPTSLAPPVAATARVAESARQAPAPPAPRDPPSDLAAEVALLHEASAALRAGEPARSLAILGAHATRFPTGALAEERDAARVFALGSLTSVRPSPLDAQACAGEKQRFLDAHPRSPHAPRVRATACAPNAPAETGSKGGVP